MGACPPASYVKFFPIMFLLYWYVLYFLLSFCRVYIHIYLQILRFRPKLPPGGLQLDPAKGLPFPRPLFGLPFDAFKQAVEHQGRLEIKIFPSIERPLRIS